ncbi:hypothetical protein, partial [Sphingomonas sp. 3P27F8]|uniref:hypothetical protein n=1 Tax=Sphingomonas sp. 3P27F8 TaxID=2502213 RepID=UPI001BB241CC
DRPHRTPMERGRHRRRHSVTGWSKVILATALMTIALACFNLSLWRRLRAARMRETPGVSSTDDHR